MRLLKMIKEVVMRALFPLRGENPHPDPLPQGRGDVQISSPSPLRGEGWGEGVVEPAFSPSSLEVMDSPPSPIGRAVSITLILLAVVLILWAVFSEMEIVVSAQGRIVPSGQVKVIQAAEPGTVTAIYVRDGQHVQQGDELIVFDNTSVHADLQRLQREYREALIRIARLSAQIEKNHDMFNPPSNANEQLVSVQKHLLESRLTQHDSKMSVLKQGIAEHKSEVDLLTSSIHGLSEELPLLERKSTKYEELVESGAVSEMEVISSKIEMMTSRRELETSKHQLTEARASLTASLRELDRAAAEFHADTLDELLQASMLRDSTEQEVIKAKQRLKQMAIVSPVDGTVQQLSINTVGGVVTAAQSLMVIVPDDSGLEVNAKVLNKDIGPLHKGLPVNLKVDAFQFTRHGMIDGDLEWVGTDSIDDKQLGLVYPVRIKLTDTNLPNIVNDKQGKLAPGMSVTADIVVGKRKVIDYFISPLLRYKDESLREM